MVWEMPTYDYKCRKCEKEFEIQQSIKADALTVCPDENCGGEIYRKISKNVVFAFKGSGFYLTDYANKHTAPATNETKEKATATEVKATTTDKSKATA